MRILGIETSCDETSCAVVEDGRAVLSQSLATLQDLFRKTTGVIPEEAARQQLPLILPMLHRALEESSVSTEGIDAIAVTRGPGLLGSLLIGTTAARALSCIWKKPLIGVHHTLGHLSSPWLQTTDDIAFPVLTLSASGGHTELWLRNAHTQGTLLGKTRDDAAGEAFDKGASILGLPYPGGPAIMQTALRGDASAFPFPLPLHGEPTLDFSFSGLKTALKYTARDLPSPLSPTQVADLAASYQRAIAQHLTDRVQRALRLHPDTAEVHLVGGVSANGALMDTIKDIAGGVPIRVPPSPYRTDNAAMIAAAAFFMISERGMSGAAETFETAASIPSLSFISDDGIRMPRDSAG